MYDVLIGACTSICFVYHKWLTTQILYEFKSIAIPFILFTNFFQKTNKTIFL